MRMRCGVSGVGIFFFNDTATTEIYTLSLHDALPISPGAVADQLHPHVARRLRARRERHGEGLEPGEGRFGAWRRSEEHTSELQSRQYLVCRLLLEKKNKLHQSNHRTLPQLASIRTER